ncbi:PTS system, lactose/cellobiose family IIC subunit [Tepidanaerobacter acetatoxydans Re1]|uniref:Permease IIC component n=1 Tax=Tepidanaerobacter acetatoxydans (strain DSM 21804 / JCM 16047 / Re1) TaxID=1209989 RepID=F4LWQ7_TEPAE|nr:PTS transporter subunit EIIC [Tepidanaerobacter acetatoxydans]AEE91779.1 PTS system, lactose/cellobiose family IIC subunit [Tepidanaerobacter acetatoxydans Re1]CCP26560.1 PTS system, lactose/cellobiose family IIC subunit [Tepidanaerobacter acetatoxydans Re1]
MMKTKNFFDKFQAVLARLAEKLDKNRYISAMKNGLTLVVPATIVGGLFLILAQPPVDPEIIAPSNFFFQLLLAWKTWSVKNAAILILPYNLTMGLLGVYAALGIAYVLAKEYEMDPINSALSSVIIFLVASASFDKSGNLIIENLSAAGLFTAIIIGLVSVEVARLMEEKNMTIKLPEQVPPMVAAPFKSLIPLIVNILLFMGINGLLGLVGTSLPNLVSSILKPILRASDSLGIVLFFCFLSRLMWFFGIHGDNVLNAVLIPITTLNLTQNAALVAAGKQPTAILSGNFITLFGAWCMLPALTLVLLTIPKSAHLKAIGKVAVIPDIFNINEPITFGLPVVANVSIVIPYIGIPMINVLIAYIASTAGLIGRVYLSLPFTTPAILQAFLSTMDWRASVLYVILLALDIIIWIPFIKGYDKMLLKEEQKKLTENSTEK